MTLLPLVIESNRFNVLLIRYQNQRRIRTLLNIGGHSTPDNPVLIWERQAYSSAFLDCGRVHMRSLNEPVGMPGMALNITYLQTPQANKEMLKAHTRKIRIL